MSGVSGMGANPQDFDSMDPTDPTSKMYDPKYAKGEEKKVSSVDDSKKASVAPVVENDEQSKKLRRFAKASRVQKIN